MCIALFYFVLYCIILLYGGFTTFYFTEIFPGSKMEIIKPTRIKKFILYYKKINSMQSENVFLHDFSGVF